MDSPDKKTVLIFGASGLLGSDVRKEALARGHLVEAPAYADVDVASDLDLNAYILNSAAEWIVNCAAYTAVDRAESEPDFANILNASTAFNIARYAGWRQLRLVHISTDFVFDGRKCTPYEETDETNPIGVYARSKLHGEQLVLDKNPTAMVVRTSWLFGANGKCFPRTILNAAREGRELRVVSDQIGSPSYTKDVAKAILNLLGAEAQAGIYHVANSGQASWFDLAVELLSAFGFDAIIEPIRTSDWPTPAVRPPYSVLSTRKYEEAGFEPLPDWRDAVQRFADELKSKTAGQ